MKKNYLIIIIIILIAAGAIYFGYFSNKKTPVNNTGGQCSIKEITFYYLEGCEWCNKVKNEGTLEKIENLGIKINKINAAVGPIRHQFEGVPTFVIDGKVYEGYRTFDEIKELLGCPKEENAQGQSQSASEILAEANFLGDKGEKVVLKNGEITLNPSVFNDNQARFFNVKMSDGKIVYFFVVKDKNGIYRAAANACQVCFNARKGFHQEGDEIVCNNCGNRYPIEKIATEKGGCNPGPINPDLEIKNSQIIIKQTDIEQVSGLF